ncbi:hypothetical protein GCM10009117_10830 [Gangjinia marincola]|uniref:DUF6036 domain-containing protein n=1 Tax=Gangjinia marincola TaxID=578463 RepID=A0ABN1MFJ9_9FLAO
MIRHSKIIDEFISQAAAKKVRMLMVGGGAVNFHGYQRHSADIDFWIETTEENFNRLLNVFKSLDYDIEDFPDTVKEGNQNIAIKFSPVDQQLELITRFSLDKSFEEAYLNSEEVIIQGNKILKWRVLSYDDLIESKLRSMRPKDLLDIQELQRINKD